MDSHFGSVVQKQLDAAMPWVGLYIAVASAVCSLATLVDAVNGLRQKKLWIPSKYSSLNAASLTLLAVAMKLPMDLNTVMIKSETDAAAKFTSLSFMSIIVTNFMPSLGSMNDKELLANVVGLGILAITVMGNVGIQFIELRHFLKPGTIRRYITIPSVLMLFSLVGLVSLAVTVSAMKRALKRIYEEKHNAMLMKEEEGVEKDDVRRHMMKYWVMAESCSPQFVMARSALCTASSIICFFSYIIIFLVHRIRGSIINAPGESPYGIYTKWILYIQGTGMDVGVIVAMLRYWFGIVMFRCSTASSNSFGKEFVIEDYWIQTLKDWRSSFSGLQIRPNTCIKFLHNLKWCVLTLCIGIQIFIVVLSKMLVFFCVFIMRPFLLCFSHIVGITSGGDTDADTDLNLSRYVLLLGGEAELPPRFVKRMWGEADRMIQTGRSMQPLNLVNLLHKSVNFNGVGEFNNSQIPSLLSQDPSDCWTLPVVTLTGIAIALPNTALHKRKQLLSSVGEGISLANIVEKTLNTSAQLNNIREAARVAWVELLLYSKWLEIDLTRSFLNCKSSEQVLQELASRAEGIVLEFKRCVQDPIMENPLNWPSKVVAANSMYRICQTILTFCRREQTGEEMLEGLSVMIADILAACLTNLPHAMIKMCHQNCIEKRERSVHEAFLLLGKTEQVVEVVGKQQRPCLDHDKAPYIEEWRAFFQQYKDNEVVSAEFESEQHFVITIN